MIYFTLLNDLALQIFDSESDGAGLAGAGQPGMCWLPATTAQCTTPSTELQISIFGYQGGEGLVSIHGHVFRHLNRAS